MNTAAKKEGGIAYFGDSVQDSVPTPRDLSLSRRNELHLLWGGGYRYAPPLSFRPLSRRSGRFPALPYPPLRFNDLKPVR